MLAAAGYNFALLLKWLALLRAWIIALLAAATTRAPTPQSARAAYFTGDEITLNEVEKIVI